MLTWAHTTHSVDVFNYLASACFTCMLRIWTYSCQNVHINSKLDVSWTLSQTDICQQLIHLSVITCKAFNLHALRSRNFFLQIWLACNLHGVTGWCSVAIDKPYPKLHVRRLIYIYMRPYKGQLVSFGLIYISSNQPNTNNPCICMCPNLTNILLCPKINLIIILKINVCIHTLSVPK